MKKLIKGIIEFRKKVRPAYRRKFAKLALGQSPDALLIACSDSRVAPNVFASSEPGDMFVVRNPGNLISPCGPDGRSVSDESEAAAIEFAVLALNVKDVIVCGHSECGAMRMLTSGRSDLRAPHLNDWLKHSGPDADQVRDSLQNHGDLAPHNHLSQMSVLKQLENLRTYPIVAERLKAGTLGLHAWYFDIAKAEVLTYDESAKKFVILDEAELDRQLKGSSRETTRRHKSPNQKAAPRV